MRYGVRCDANQTGQSAADLSAAAGRSYYLAPFDQAARPVLGVWGGLGSSRVTANGSGTDLALWQINSKNSFNSWVRSKPTTALLGPGVYRPFLGTVTSIARLNDTAKGPAKSKMN